MDVKIIRLGEHPQEIRVPEGTNVEQAISRVGWSTTGFRIAVNGDTNTQLHRALRQGYVITMNPKVEGGRQ